MGRIILAGLTLIQVSHLPIEFYLSRVPTLKSRVSYLDKKCGALTNFYQKIRMQAHPITVDLKQIQFTAIISFHLSPTAQIMLFCQLFLA